MAGASQSYAAHAARVFDEKTKRGAYRELVAAAKPLIEADNRGATPQDEDTVVSLTNGETMVVRFSPAKHDPRPMRDSIEAELAHMNATVHMHQDAARLETSIVVQVSLPAYADDLATRNAQDTSPRSWLRFYACALLIALAAVLYLLVPYKTKRHYFESAVAFVSHLWRSQQEQH